MLKRQLKRSSRYNEDGAMPVLLSKDLEKNLDNVDTKMEETEIESAIALYKEKGFFDAEEDKDAIEVLKAADYTIKANSRGTVHVIELERMNEDSKWSVCKDKEKDYYYICSDAKVYTKEDGDPMYFDTYEEAEEFLKQLTSESEEFLAEDEDAEEPTEEPTEEIPTEDPEEILEEPTEEIPTALDTDMEEPEETFKDINEKVVVYLYRGFAELGDAVRVFVEDEGNEERDPELVRTLSEFMEGYPEVMDVIKEMAKAYVTSVELFDPEEEEEITEEPVEDEEVPDEEIVDDIELEDDIEDAEIVEAYIKEHELDHNLFESEYEIYASYTSEDQAIKYEEDFKKFRGTEVFRHEDIGEIHAFVRVK